MYGCLFRYWKGRLDFKDRKHYFGNGPDRPERIILANFRLTVELTPKMS